MLTQVIAHAVVVADEVSRLAGLPSGEPQAVLGHVRNFEAAIVPELKQTQVRTSAVAASLAGSLADILPKIEGGAAPAGFTDRLQELSKELRSVAPHVEHAEDQLNRFRTTFSEDVAQLIAVEIRLTARAKAVAGDQARLRKEAGKLRARIDIINRLSSLNPFIKLGSELANLITKHKTTEASLAEASRDLARANRKAADLHSAVAHVEPMKHLVDQLATNTQGIKNTVTLIGDKLANESAFLNGAKRETELFLTALQSSVDQLESLVS